MAGVRVVVVCSISGGVAWFRGGAGGSIFGDVSCVVPWSVGGSGRMSSWYFFVGLSCLLFG